MFLNYIRGNSKKWKKVLNSISFLKSSSLNNSIVQGGATQAIRSSIEQKPDSFNGKVLQPKNTSIFQQVLSFLGQKTENIRNNANTITFMHNPNPEEEITIGSYGYDERYRNIFNVNLKATPNPNLAEELSRDPNIYNLNEAERRISSLSKYLKENMVGFITPYGYHWFPSALENFIYGANNKRVPIKEFKNTAKELWSLLAKADPYWTSNEFIKYLRTMDQTFAVVATINAVKEIQLERKKLSSNITFGYNSKMKDMPKLLNSGCAYSGVKLSRSGYSTNKVSVEHIFPNSLGGSDDDFNYLLTAGDANNERGLLPLLDFLRGKSAGIQNNQ